MNAEMIKELNYQKDKLTEKLKTINDTIKSLQKLCEHTTADSKSAFEYEGHDSHKNYYKCSICGKSDWR